MDMDIKFNDIKKIIRDVKKEKKAIIYFKFKPQISFSFQQKMINFFDIEGIKYFQYESLNEIAKKIRFDFFLASVTTALLEAPLYGAMPLKLCNNNDFANDLIIDKVVIPIKKISDIVSVIKKKPSIKKINKIKKKIWGLKKNNSLTTRNILSNLIK